MILLALMQRHRRVTILVVAVVLLLLAHPLASADSDLFQNVGPAPQVVNGLSDQYPLGNYALDTHVKGVSVGLSGADTGDVPAQIAGFLANAVWQFTAWLANAMISLFTFAFSLDLVNGSSATGGAGALQPVSNAIHNIYKDTFGAEWMVVGILLAAFWAMWRALVQRRFTEVAGALALSIAFAVIALAFVARPDLTVGQGSKLSNEMSAAFLSVSKTGEPTSEQQAKKDSSDQLFKLLVYDPWTVLNFGGLEHCTTSGPDGDSGPPSAPVRPLSRNPGQDATLSRQLAGGTQVKAAGKTCINNQRKYAAHFLRWSPGDKKRSGDDQGAYKALSDGDANKLPTADPGKKSANFGPADKPASDAMESGGQFNRLVMAIVIFLGELGALILLGALSVGVILAQVVVLLLLAFAPVMLVLGILPGRGHQAFIGWLSKMVAFLLRKAIYSLLLAVLLALGSALTTASANLGWFMAFGLQGVFFWAIFLYRKELVGQFNGVIAGAGGQGGDGLRRLQSTYYSARMLKSPARAVGAAPIAAAAGVGAVAAAPLALLARKRAKEKGADRAAGDRQDLADRTGEAVAAKLKPPDDGSSPDTSSPTDPAPTPELPLLRRYPARPRGGPGDHPPANGGGRNGPPDGPGSRGGARPPLPNVGSHQVQTGNGQRSPDSHAPGSPTAPPPPAQPRDPSPGQGAGSGSGSSSTSRRSEPPPSLNESLKEDVERLRQRREATDRSRQNNPPPRRPPDDKGHS